MIYIDKPIRGYASKITDRGNFATGTVSTSREKTKGQKDYVKSFWNATFKQAPTEGKLTITKAIMTNEKSEKDGKYYVNLKVLEFEQEPHQDFHPADDEICKDCGKPLNDCECLPF